MAAMDRRYPCLPFPQHRRPLPHRRQRRHRHQRRRQRHNGRRIYGRIHRGFTWLCSVGNQADSQLPVPPPPPTMVAEEPFKETRLDACLIGQAVCLSPFGHVRTLPFCVNLVGHVSRTMLLLVNLTHRYYIICGISSCYTSPKRCLWFPFQVREILVNIDAILTIRSTVPMVVHRYVCCQRFGTIATHPTPLLHARILRLGPPRTLRRRGLVCFDDVHFFRCHH